MDFGINFLWGAPRALHHDKRLFLSCAHAAHTGTFFLYSEKEGKAPLKDSVLKKPALRTYGATVAKGKGDRVQ